VQPANGYGGVAKTLHWLVFALVFAQFVVAIAMPDIGRGTVPGTLINLHMSIGATILLVVVLRWLWRIGHPVPLATGDMPQWEQRVARVTHALLYALLAINPVLGWMNASARDWTITLYGSFTLPHLVAPRARIGVIAGDVHTFLAWTLLVLIGLHVAAALHHGFVRRDGVLQRMLLRPARATPTSRANSRP
jgi:cytochrome b561